MTLATQDAVFQGFTADSHSVVYLTGYGPSTYYGTLQATTLAGVTTQIGANAFTAVFGAGGIVVSNDDNNVNDGLGSLHVTDLTKGGPPALVATAIEYDVLDATGTRVFYSAVFPESGVYVANVGGQQSRGGPPGHKRHGPPPWASRGQLAPGGWTSHGMPAFLSSP